MLTTLATLVAVSLTLQQGEGRGEGRGQGGGSGDTTVAVQSGARLDVNNFGGEIVVHTWNQNNVKVRSSHSSRSRVDVSTSASTVLVRTAGRRGPPSIVDLDITVPTWMAMSLSGTYTDISVDGAGGAVTAESVQGDIEVTGGTGNVALKSVEGGVTLAKTKGRIEVNSVEGDITITDAGPSTATSFSPASTRSTSTSTRWTATSRTTARSRRAAATGWRPTTATWRW